MRAPRSSARCPMGAYIEVDQNSRYTSSGRWADGRAHPLWCRTGIRLAWTTTTAGMR
jgi:hypothetical protein